MRDFQVNKFFLRFFFLLICASVLLVYSNVFINEFVWDDEVLIVRNPLVKSFASLPKVFSSGLFEAFDGTKGSFYRPLQTISYMVDYHFWKLSPLGYHITNLILHLLCALVFYLVVQILTGDVRPAFIAGTLFAIHPLHTQAVAYIAGRADLLCVFFMLVSFLCFRGFLETRKKRSLGIFYAGSWLAFVTALLSKEISVVTPLFFLLYIFVFRPKEKGFQTGRDVLKTWPFFAAVVLYAILRFTVLNFFDGTYLAETPLYLRLLTTAKNIFAYLGLLIVPSGLHMEREVVFVSSFFSVKVMLAFAALAAIGVWMSKMRKINPVIFFFSSWFFLGMVPVSNIFPLNATLAEHWVYLSSMGVFALAGLGCQKILDLTKDKSKMYFIKGGLGVFLVGLVVTYGFLTFQRNKAWRTPLTIFLDTARYVPDNYKVRNNLGKEYLGKGLLDEALQEFEASLKIQPDFAYTHSNLGVVYADKGWYEKAIAEYKKALELNPALSKTYVKLAEAYFKTGAVDEALKIQETGGKFCPDNPFLYSMFGLQLAENAQTAQAVLMGERSVELDSGNAMLHYHLAVIYEYNDKGVRCGKGFRLEEARQEYQKAIELDKGYQNAQYNLAVLYEFNAEGIRYGKGFDIEAAQDYYLRVLRLDPQDLKARYNLEYLRKNFSPARKV